jgi:hypothetical protein
MACMLETESQRIVSDQDNMPQESGQYSALHTIRQTDLFGEAVKVSLVMVLGSFSTHVYQVYQRAEDRHSWANEDSRCNLIKMTAEE